MISKQKPLIIIAVVLIIIAISSLFFLTNKPESENSKIYIQALAQYNNSHFKDAYYAFSKVSRASTLKPVAIYRQALCAEKLGDEKLEIKKYREISGRYPNSILAIRAKYLKAQRFYEDKNFKKAKKEFNELSHKYSRTDYAIASQYYLGSIEAEQAQNIKNKKKKLKTQNRAIQYFKSYLKWAPKGRFSLNCIQKWTAFNPKLNNEDNLVIAKVYLENQDYNNAQKYLKFTNLSASWPYFVKTAYGMKDYSKVKYYTQQGLKGKGPEDILINESNNDKSEIQNIYEAIDLYLKVSDSPKLSLSYLMSISEGSKGYDYLLYKNCTNMPANAQTACFNTLYYKYPQGQFAAEALSNIFYEKILARKYYMAKKIGRMHLSKYPHSNSTPRVMFWLAKIAERTKNYEEARSYYKTLMRQFPDDYYAYHSFLNLNRFRHFRAVNIVQKPVEFPYENSSSALIVKLAEVKDYGLINQLYKDDEFVQSWLAYLEGNFSTSARIARDAMEKLSIKPARTDLRWRLVYPVHYYNEIEQSANNWKNDPILILSIIREESYFNPKVKSAVGASGLMQLMPATAREAGNIGGIDIPSENLLFDPDINIRLGNIYYSRLKRALMNKDIFAVLAYNGGLSSVSRWEENLKYVDVDDFVEQIPYPETQNYLKKVFRSYWNYLRIYSDVRF